MHETGTYNIKAYMRVQVCWCAQACPNVSILVITAAIILYFISFFKFVFSNRL